MNSYTEQDKQGLHLQTANILHVIENITLNGIFPHGLRIFCHCFSFVFCLLVEPNQLVSYASIPLAMPPFHVRI